MKVFVASSMPTAYPWKLQKPATINSRIRATADEFIFDSGIGDDTTTGEVLGAAHEHDADYVVAVDELHDFETTTRNAYEFLDRYEDHPCTATPMIPVQCDPARDKWHADHLQALPDHTHYVLGGMKDDGISERQKICAVREFREAVGSDAYVHGLGIGGGIEIASKVAGTGWLDSVDCSTPEQAAISGDILDPRLRHTDAMVFPGGEGRTKRTYPLAEFNSWQIHDVWVQEAKHGGLAAYQ
jgi:hypothetical protein